MAMYPCDIGMHRYREPQQTLYPALMRLGRTERRKLRLCPQHLAELLDWADGRMQAAQDDFTSRERSLCPVCGDLPTRDDQAAFFVTAYTSGDERRDYWAPVCGACTAALRAAWQLDQE